MILITKNERKALDEVGLLKYKRTGYNPQDQNFQVVNREHCGRDKSIYVTEEPEIMAFLGRYENLNLQKINESQVNQLKTGRFLNETIVKNGVHMYLMRLHLKIEKASGE